MLHIAFTGRGDTPVYCREEEIGAQRREVRVVGMIKARVFIGLLAHIGINPLDEPQFLRDMSQGHHRAIFQDGRGLRKGGVSQQSGEALLLGAQVFLEHAFHGAVDAFFLRDIPVAFPFEIFLFESHGHGRLGGRDNKLDYVALKIP